MYHPGTLSLPTAVPSYIWLHYSGVFTAYTSLCGSQFSWAPLCVLPSVTNRNTAERLSALMAQSCVQVFVKRFQLGTESGRWFVLRPILITVYSVLKRFMETAASSAGHDANICSGITWRSICTDTGGGNRFRQKHSGFTDPDPNPLLLSFISILFSHRHTHGGWTADFIWLIHQLLLHFNFYSVWND